MAEQKFGEVTMDLVISRINEIKGLGGLKLPPEYSPENAVRVAWLMLLEQKMEKMDGQPCVLDYCTPNSISNALLKMVIQGLNPVKAQCAFIPAGKELRCQREYMGTISMAKRHGLKDVQANPIYKTDKFSFSIDSNTGKKSITSHEQTLESVMEGTIIGAYAIVTLQDGSTNAEVMTMPQIQASWEMGPMKGQSPAHKKFPDQMCCKTVINRALKPLIQSSDDSDLFDDGGEPMDSKSVVVATEIKNEANKEEFGFDKNEVPVDTKALPQSEATPAPVIEIKAKEAVTPTVQDQAQPEVKQKEVPF